MISAEGSLLYRSYVTKTLPVSGNANIVKEVDRAVDNLVKSGKLFGMPSRRDSMPLVGAPRPYSDYGKRHH